MKNKISLSILSLAVLLSCKNSQLTNTAADTKSVSVKLTDNQLMDKVQSDALKYFWDFAEPNSLLGRERYHEDNIYPDNDKHVVTTGGSGFGLMTILVGVDRKYIPRREAVKRLTHIADFLEKADRFHGAWSHWINGETGKVVPFGKRITAEILLRRHFWFRE
jgi:hypothetical protein